MKKIFAVIMVLLLSFVMYSCQDNGLNLGITVEQCTDYKIDEENKYISINVDSSVDKFDLNNLKCTETYIVSFYKDDSEKTELTDRVVELFYGYNAYILRLTSTHDEKFFIEFKVSIYRNADTINRILVSDAWKRNYDIGEEFSESELVLYSGSGEESRVPFTKDMITGFDTSTVGTNKEATVTYLTFTVNVKYNVFNIPSDIKIKNLKTEYSVDDKFEEGTLTVTYKDGSTNDVPITLDMVKDFSTAIAGEYELTIFFDGKEIVVPYKVNEAIVIKNVEVKFNNAIYVGDKFPSDANLVITFSNNEVVTKPLTEDIVKDFDTSHAGKKNLVVVIDNTQYSCPYEVLEVYPTEIVTVTKPKFDYGYKEEFVPFKVYVLYNNGSKSKEITINKDMVSGFSTDTVGTFRFSYTIEGITNTVSYNVDKVITNITINPKTQSIYYLNDLFKGIVIDITYNDGSSVTETLTDASLFDSSVAGVKTIKVNYRNYEFEFTYTIYDLVIEKIANSSFPQTVYLNKSPRLGKIAVYFIGGRTDYVDITPNMINGFDNKSLGLKEAIITYEGFEIVVSYEVVEDSIWYIFADIPSIHINDEFPDASLYVTYHSGETETVALTSDMVTGFDTTTLGYKTITITYKDYQFNTTYKVNNILDRIELVENNHTYVVGDKLKDIFLMIYYTDNTSEKVLLSKYDIKFSSDIVGSFETNITYTVGRYTKECTYSYNVIGIEVEKIELVNFTYDYFVGDKFKNGTLKVIYNNGEFENVIAEEKLIEGFDTETSGNKILTIIYKTFTLEVEYTVTEVIVTDIITKDLKNTYIKGKHELTGKIEVIYNNNSRKYVNVSDLDIVGFSAEEVGTFTIQITYDNYTVDFTYIVHHNLESISVVTFKSNYYVGDEFVEGVLLLKFADGTTEHVRLTQDLVTGFDTTTEGKITLTITYEYLEITYDIVVSHPYVLDYEVIDYKHIYKVGEEFSGVSYRFYLSNGKYSDVKFAEGKLFEDFDSSKPGVYKLFFINLNNVDYFIDYRVLDKLESIKVLNFNDKVTVGEKFTNGILELIYADGFTYNVPLTEDLVVGFDTTSVGNKPLSITYENITIEHNLNVIGDVLPEETIIDNQLLLKALKRIYVTLGYMVPDGKIDLISDNAVNSFLLTKPIVAGIKAAHISNEQLEALIELFDRCELNKLLDFNSTELFVQKLMIEKNYNSIVDFIIGMKNIINRVQLYTLVSKVMDDSYIDNMLSYLERDLANAIGTTQEEVIKNEIKKYKDLQAIFGHNKEFKQLLYIAYEFVDIINQIPHRDFVFILNAFMGGLTPETPSEEIVTLVKSVSKVLKLIQNSGLVDRLYAVCEAIFTAFSPTPISEPSINIIMNGSYLAIDNFGLVINLLDSIDSKSVDALKFMMSLNGFPQDKESQEAKDFVSNVNLLVPYVRPIIAEYETNRQFRQNLKYLLSSIRKVEFSTFEPIFIKVIELSKQEAISYDDILVVIDLIQNVRPKHVVAIDVSSHAVLFKSGTTHMEAINLMEKYSGLTILGADGLPVQLLASYFHFETLDTPGRYLGYIICGDLRATFTYIVYDSIDDFVFNYIKVDKSDINHNNDIYYHFIHKESFIDISLRIDNNMKKLVSVDGKDYLKVDYYFEMLIPVCYENSTNNLDFYDINDIVVNSEKSYKLNLYGTTYNINLESLVDQGLDLNKTGIQYIDYLHNGRIYNIPVIYEETDRNNYIELGIIPKDLEAYSLYGNLSLDKKDYDVYYNEKVMSKGDFITALEKYFEYKLNLSYERNHIIFADKYHNEFRININKKEIYYNVEYLDNSFLVDSLSEITLEKLANAISITVGEYKCDSYKLLSLLASENKYRVDSFDLNEVRLSFSGEEITIEFKIYIKDETNRTLITNFSYNDKYLGIFSRLLTLEEIRKEVMNKIVYTEVTTSKKIRLTGSALYDYIIVNNYFIDEYREGSTNYKITIFDEYRFDFYYVVDDLKPKVDCIEIPEHYEKEEYIKRNIQLYFSSEAHGLCYWSIKRIDFTDAKAKIYWHLNINPIEINYKVLPKDKYVVMNSSVSSPIDVFINQANVEYFKNKCSGYFENHGFPEPTVRLDSNYVTFKFDDEFTYKIKYNKLPITQLTEELVMSKADFNHDYIEKNLSKYVDYDTSLFHYEIVLYHSNINIILTDKNTRKHSVEIVVHFIEDFSITQHKYDIHITNEALNEQVLRDNVRQYFYYSFDYNVDFTVSWNDNVITYDFGKYGVFTINYIITETN